LTEMIEDRAGRRVPVVGLGINVGPLSFPPELAERATSLASHGRQVDPRELARAVLERTDALPEPHAWQDLEVVWRLFDATAGKRYRLRDGRDAIGLGVGPNGELLCAVDGESTTVMGVDY
ncbi:MAG TPA: hypothetical protein VM328_01915, partial [Fimbriimonadaceae bacterium]|nr:hypothetical protein [Fimbriimonadaceae bacterium]